MKNNNQNNNGKDNMNLTPEEINELMNVLSNKEKMKKILESKEAKELLQKLGGNKNG
ncbi:MAG: hypothetical protein PUD72_08125 [Oscillospiraceae bacterium]|nr:hypothetical protein [Oscillospiraceae bacterium]